MLSDYSDDCRLILRTLLSEEFAPITSEIGFIEGPLGLVAEALSAWRRDLYGDEMNIVSVSEGFPEVLTRLEPLTTEQNREILTRTGSGWTAYFNSGWRGTDAWPPTTYLSEKLDARAVIVTTVPHGRAGAPNRRLGSVQFSLYGPENDGHWLNSIRSVAAHFESRWEFRASGEVQPFEEVEAYENRRIRDRLTPEMVERYCRSLGIDVFNPDFYKSDAFLFERVRSTPLRGRSMSLSAAQQALGIVPGAK